MKRKSNASGFSQDAQETQIDISSDNDEPSSPTPDDPEDPPGRPAKRARTIAHNCDSTTTQIGTFIDALDLGQKRFLAYHFCFYNDIDVQNGLKTINNEGVFFVTGQHQAQWERWLKSKDPRVTELVALYQSEKEKENWPDCNGGLEIQFKCPQEDDWMMSTSFWKMLVITFISLQHDYENKDVLLAELDQFFNYNEWDNFESDNREEDNWEESSYFLFHIWLHELVDGGEYSRLVLLVEHWKNENNCTPLVGPAKPSSSVEVPKVFKDFIAKGIFFSFYFL